MKNLIFGWPGYFRYKIALVKWLWAAPLMSEYTDDQYEILYERWLDEQPRPEDYV